jgi:hypothetical protein
VTTETEARTKIRAQLKELVPYPAGDDVTARQVAAYLATETSVAWARMMDTAGSISTTDVAIVMGQFAAAHLLLALAEADEARANEAAAQIRDAWEDGGGQGEWTWEHLTRLGLPADRIIALAGELAAATRTAAPPEGAETAKLREVIATLSRIVSQQCLSMEAARVEMRQNGPQQAMQWILNSLPDVWDGPEGSEWDGTESAQAWMDRLDALEAAK